MEGKTHRELVAENEDLRARLAEAEETLRAIHSGEVDALVVATTAGEQVFTLTGAERAYRLLIEAMNEGALTLALDGVILYCNACFATLVKTPLEKVMGGSIRRFVAPSDLPLFEVLLQQGWQGSSRGELTFRAGDGTLLPVYLSVSALQTGEVAGALSLVATDLTAQKRSEEIVAAEKLARSILEQAAEAIVVCDDQGRVVRASQAAHWLCGGNPLLQPFEAAFPLRLASATAGDKGTPFSISAALQGETRHGLEVVLERGDAQVFDLLLSLGPLMSGQAVLGCVVTLTDITERKRAEQETRRLLDQAQRSRRVLLGLLEDQKQVEKAVRESELKYRRLYESMIDGFVYVDMTGRIRETNESYRQMLGYSSEELAQLTYVDLTPERWHAYEQSLVDEQILPMGYSQVYEKEYRKKDGTVFPVELRTFLIKDQRSSPQGMWAIVRDVTARKQAEEQIRHHAEQMEGINTLGRALAETLDVDRIFNLLGEAIWQLLPDISSLFISRFNPQAGLITCAYANVDGNRLDAAGLPPIPLEPPGVGTQSEAIHTRRPVIINNLREHLKRKRIKAVDAGTDDGRVSQSGLYIPMIAQERVVGVVQVQSYSLNRFAEADAKVLGLAANTAAVALENARLFAETRHRLVELEAVNRVSTALRVAQTLDEMLPLLLDETLAVLQTDAGIIFEYDGERDLLRKAVARGWYTRMPDTPIKSSDCVAGQAIVTGEPYRSREFTSDPRLRDLLYPAIPAGWGGAGAPIRAAQEIIGVICVSVPLPRELSADEVHLLTTLAEIAGTAIQRTRLHEQTVRQVERLAALHTIDAAISGVFDLRVTFDVLLSQVTTQLNVDAAAVLLLDPNTLQLEYAVGKGFRGRGITRLALRLGEDHAGRAAWERRLIHVPNLAEAPFSRPELTAGEGFVTYFGAPLLAKGQIKGVLELFYRAPFSPDPQWLDFLGILAGQAAIAIDNAQLFEQSQRLTADLVLAYDVTLEGWARALELRDRETEGHTQRVTELTVRLARALGMSEAELVHVRRGALLHDIGKMGIPDGILLKPGELTDAEWEIMRQHPQFAYDMLQPIAYLRPALDIPYGHHEKWDGTGYPRGLRGKQIPLAARIFAVVDVWDALRSDRPYRPAWSDEQVLEYIESQAGKHFDPRVVEVFLQMVDGIHPSQGGDGGG